MTAESGAQLPSVRRGARPPLIRLLPDLGLGAAAATGLAPFGLWFLALPALAALIWRAARATPAGAFWHMLVAGIGWFGLGLCWIVEPFLVEPEIYGWMAPFALVLMAVGGGLFWAVPATLAARLTPRWRARAATIPAALVLSDWLRGWIFTGFPWALTGHVWVDTPVAQLAAWGGAIGLGALTLTMAALPTLLWRASGPHARGVIPGTAAAIVLLGAAWAAGLDRLATPMAPDTPHVVRIVQPDAEQHLKWDPEWSAIFYRRLLDLSARPGPHDLTIWPETAVNFLLNDAATVTPTLAAASGGPLVLGIQRREDSRYYNSLVALDAAGAVTQTYDKFHLVPFGEYMPWGDALAVIGITAFAAQQGNGYSAGPGPTVMRAGALPPFQPLICYEAIFPQHLRNLPTRPAWLLQATNDGWFGRISGPHQHLAQARLRAIETGLPLMRAANTGISAAIDPYGRLRQTLDLGEVGIIDAALPAPLPATFWLAWGPLPVLIVLAGILGLGAMTGRRRR